MRLLTMGSFLLIVAHAGSGHAATPPQPEPGPEVQRLGYYVGTWRGEGETKGGPFRPAGKPAKLRYAEVQVSPTLFTYQGEASVDGAPWTMIAEGKVAKVK